MVSFTSPVYLHSFDYDGTLSTDLQQASKYQQQNPEIKLQVNTGRTTQDLHGISDYFQGVKIHSVGTGNGECLFINHGNLNGDQFIRHIAEGKVEQDPQWKELLLKQDGWDHDRVVKIIRQAKGYYKLGNGYGDTDFRASAETAKNVIQALKTQNIKAQFATEERDLRKISPLHNSKASPIEFICKRLDGIKGVIIAGDSTNDYPMMALNQVINKEGQSVPVLPIAMDHGDDFVRTVMMQKAQQGVNPEIVAVASRTGDRLWEAAEKQLQKLIKL